MCIPNAAVIDLYKKEIKRIELTMELEAFINERCKLQDEMKRMREYGRQLQTYVGKGGPNTTDNDDGIHRPSKKQDQRHSKLAVSTSSEEANSKVKSDDKLSKARASFDLLSKQYLDKSAALSRVTKKIMPLLNQVEGGMGLNQYRSQSCNDGDTPYRVLLEKEKALREDVSDVQLALFLEDMMMTPRSRESIDAWQVEVDKKKSLGRSLSPPSRSTTLTVDTTSTGGGDGVPHKSKGLGRSNVWEPCQDATTGRIYYKNVDTQDVQWGPLKKGMVVVSPVKRKK